MTNSEPIIPPEEDLLPPENVDLSEGDWFVVARNRRVNNDWKQLLTQYPENSSRCYVHLLKTPMQRIRGRIFPLKGKKYKGAWEYELTGGDRVFYVPSPEQRKVVVYYAGPHPKKSPTPPKK